MLKPIDVLVGLKIVASPPGWTQLNLAAQLCLSVSQVHSAIKRLEEAGLLVQGDSQRRPIYSAFEEFILHGIKYCYPVKPGELTIGEPTAYAAEPLASEIMPGNDPVPVWPDAFGKVRGMSVEPLHPNVPKALRENPDPKLHTMLVLIDALRVGRARERNIALKKLKALLKECRK